MPIRADGITPASESSYDPGCDAAWVWAVARRDPDLCFRRLAEHDSIHLQAAVPPRLAARFLLLDAERVFVRACARIAYAASLTPVPDLARLGEWLLERVDEAADDCLRTDEELLERGVELEDPLEHHAQYHWTFMVPIPGVLEASVRFNGLSEITRRSFFALLIDQHSVEDVLAMGLGPAEVLRDRVRAALNAAAGIASED